MYEGGLRVPLGCALAQASPAPRIVSMRIHPPSVARISCPTLCALTGVSVNAADFDGEDASAAWLGEGEHVRTKPLLWKYRLVRGSDAGHPGGAVEAHQPYAKERRRDPPSTISSTIQGEKQNIASRSSRHREKAFKKSGALDSLIAEGIPQG